MRIAIYSRKSIETDTGESIKNQIKMCKEYFARQFQDCKFEVFEDEGFSGGNTNRPDFQRMFNLIKMKQFDIVAVYKIDRIARNIVDFVNIFDEMENYNVKLVSITEGFDATTPAGKMMMMLLASFAEMERMNIAQRVKDNMIELAKLGRWSGGTIPFGYTSVEIMQNNKRFVYLKLVEDEGLIIKEIFEMYATGYSSYEISDFLTNKGYSIRDHYVLEILKNPTYLKSSPESIKYLESIGYRVYGEANGCGFLPYNRRPRLKGVKSYNDKSKIAGISKHEAVIDYELWSAAHSKLKEKSMDPRPRESNFTYLSGGIVKCKCGATMEVCVGRKRADGTRLYYFRCVNACGNLSLRVDKAEDYVMNFIEKLSDKDYLRSLFEKTNPPKSVSSQINAINKKITQNTNAINSLIDKLMLLSNDASTLITQRMEQLSKDNIKLKEELLRLDRKKMYEQQDESNIDILHKQVLIFLALKGNTNELRRVIKTIVKNLFWDSDTEFIDVKLISL